MPDSPAHPWEAAWKEERWLELSPPLPAVINFIDFLRRKGGSRVLDVGCGAGRHAIALAKEGFQVTGLDVSDTALGELQARAEKANLSNITLVRHEMAQLPFINNYFDAMVSTNVLHHGTLMEIKQTVRELNRIMKTGAIGLVVTLSKRDFRYGDGNQIEEDTFVFTEGDEKGITHHFFLESDLRSVFEEFDIQGFIEELIPVGRGNRAHFFLIISKE